jgi:hypothetical protein
MDTTLSAVETYDDGSLVYIITGWWSTLLYRDNWAEIVGCWLHGAAMAVPLNAQACREELQFLRVLVRVQTEYYKCN